MIKYLIPGFIVLFGFMTLREGGSVLFFDGIARQEAGAFVPFVLFHDCGGPRAGLELVRSQLS